LAVIMGRRGEEVVEVGVKGQGGEGKVVKEGSSMAGRFAALRSWVGTNMERHPAFEK